MPIRTISNTGGDWNATTSWVEGAVPTAADDVVATASSGNLTITASCACRSADFTNYTGILTQNSATAWSIGDASGGGLRFVPGMTYTPVSSTNSSVYFVSTSNNGGAGWNIYPAGKLFTTVQFQGIGGRWSLQGDLSVVAAITQTQGTLDTNNYAITAASFNASGTGTKTINFGSSTISCSGAGHDYSSANTTVNAASASFVFTGSSTAPVFRGASHTFGALTDSRTGGGFGAITGSPTFGNLVLDNGGVTRTITFDAGATITILGTFEASGTAGHLLTFQRSSGASFAFSKASGVVALDYVSMANCDAIGGATWYAGSHSTDGGLNTGWLWSDPPVGSTDLIGSLVGVACPSGGLLTGIYLNSSPAGAAFVAANLGSLVDLLGSLYGVSNPSGDLLTEVLLSGGIEGHSFIVSPFFDTPIELIGFISGSGTLKDLFVARSSLPVILARVEQAERLTNSVEKNSFLFSISAAERRLNARVDKKSNSLLVTLQS